MLEKKTVTLKNIISNFKKNDQEAPGEGSGAATDCYTTLRNHSYCVAGESDWSQLKKKIICTVRSEGEDDTTRPNPGWRDPVASMSDRVWSVNSPPEDSPSVMLSASQARLGIVLRHQGRSDPVELKGNKGGERGRRWGVRRIGMREGKG